MMMRMLAAGGIEIVTDSMRQADADNPYGYYEYENVKRIKKDASWLDNTYGKAFKMVLSLLYDLPMDRTYKIIVMERNMQEVLISQRIMLQRQGKEVSGPGDERLAHMFARHIATTKAWLQDQKNMDVIYMHYHDVLSKPRESAEKVQQFLGQTLDTERMVVAVDVSLYRNRAPSR
jgi:Sulfotransferase domain